DHGFSKASENGFNLVEKPDLQPGRLVHAVVGVRRIKAAFAAAQDGRGAPEQAGLRTVGVHNVRLYSFYKYKKPDQGRQVERRGQVGNLQVDDFAAGGTDLLHHPAHAASATAAGKGQMELDRPVEEDRHQPLDVPKNPVQARL